MGIYQFNSPCLICGKLFRFHPNKVPSIPIKDGKPHPDGIKMPLCKDCVDNVVNPVRIQKGLPIIEYASDAYKENLDEEEDYIDWESKGTVIQHD